MYLCACLLDDANWSEVCEWSDEEVSVLTVFYFDFVEFVKSSFACCIVILCSEQINMFNIH